MTVRMLQRLFILLMFSLSVMLLGGRAFAQDVPQSQCLAIAGLTPHRGPEIAPPVIFAKFDLGGAGEATPFAPLLPTLKAQPTRSAEEVLLTYFNHSTWSILSPGGVLAATDFAGWSMNPLPQIATMNNAHRTHWTPNPDPAIRHVLKGWSTDGVTPARHAIVEGDMFVRNVSTDTRFGGEMTAYGNSIFIFEVAGLCIGHLGHLHHALDDRHFAEIGRLDIMMVPVDGGLTLSQEGMSELVKRLQPSVLLPMHLRGNSIERFVGMLGDGFDARYLNGDDVRFSLSTLPKRPTMFVPLNLN
jgi:hypothetical protein